MDDLDELQRAWADQTVEVRSLDPETLILRSQALERKIRRRNLREHAAGIVVALAFGWIAWVSAAPLARLGAALVVAGDLVVMITLARRGKPTSAPDALVARCLDWQRQELERERALLAGIRWWYLGPLVPGVTLFLLSRLLEAAGPLQRALTIGVGITCGRVFIAIDALNRAAVRRLQDALDALDALDTPNTPNTPNTPDALDTPNTPDALDTPNTPDALGAPQTATPSQPHTRTPPRGAPKDGPTDR